MTTPRSTNGRKPSCWARLKRWISSTNRSVPLPVAAFCLRGLLERGAQVTWPRSCWNQRLARLASRRAIVVLPVPGGPPQDQACQPPLRQHPADRPLRTKQGASWPTTWPRVSPGRRRSASGASVGPAASKRSLSGNDLARHGVRGQGRLGPRKRAFSCAGHCARWPRAIPARASPVLLDRRVEIPGGADGRAVDLADDVAGLETGAAARSVRGEIESTSTPSLAANEPSPPRPGEEFRRACARERVAAADLHALGPAMCPAGGPSDVDRLRLLVAEDARASAVRLSGLGPPR